MRACLPFRKPGGGPAEQGIGALARQMWYRPACVGLKSVEIPE